MRLAPRLPGFGFGAKKPVTALAQWAGWSLAIDFRAGQYRVGSTLATDLTSLPGYAKSGTNAITAAGYHVTANPSRINLTAAFPSGDFVALAVVNAAGVPSDNEVLCEFSDGAGAARLFLIRQTSGDLTAYHNTPGYFPAGQNLPGAGRMVIAYGYQAGTSQLFTKAGNAAAAFRVDAPGLAPPTINQVSLSTTFTGDASAIGDEQLVGILPGTFTNAAICALMDRV